MKIDLNQSLSYSGTLINPPYKFSLNLNNINNHSNIQEFYQKTEYFVQDKYCQKTNNFLRTNENEYRNYKNYNNNYNNHNKRQNYQDSNCMIEKIEIQKCYQVDTDTSLTTTTLNNSTNLNDFNTFSNVSQNVYCSPYENNRIVDDLEFNNINRNLLIIKDSIIDYIKPNISIQYINVFESVDSLNIDSIDKNNFEKSVDLINDKNFKQAEFLLTNIYNSSSSKYGKIPYEVKFNL